MRAMHESSSLSMDSIRFNRSAHAVLARKLIDDLSSAQHYPPRPNSHAATAAGTDTSPRLRSPIRQLRFMFRSSSKQRSTLPFAFRDLHGEEYVCYQNR